MGAWVVWMLTSIDLNGGGRTLDFPWGREPCLLLGLEREGQMGRRWKFLINKLIK